MAKTKKSKVRVTLEADLSPGGPYATNEDRRTAREAKITVRQLRADRFEDDVRAYLENKASGSTSLCKPAVFFETLRHLYGSMSLNAMTQLYHDDVALWVSLGPEQKDFVKRQYKKYLENPLKFLCSLDLAEQRRLHEMLSAHLAKVAHLLDR